MPDAICSHCGTIHPLTDAKYAAYFGKKAQCKGCGASFVVGKTSLPASVEEEPHDERVIDDSYVTADEASSVSGQTGVAAMYGDADSGTVDYAMPPSYAPAPRTKRTTTHRSWLGRFVNFEVMWTMRLITLLFIANCILFAISEFLIIVAMLYGTVLCLSDSNFLGAAAAILIGLFLMLLPVVTLIAIRLSLEWVAVFFRINNTLTEIRDSLESGRNV